MASDYSELSRRIKHAGLLRRRSAYYAAKIASTAVLLVAVTPQGRHIEQTRIAEALIGGAAALLVTTVLLPLNPLRLINRSAGPAFDAVSEQLDADAKALLHRDAAAADRALTTMRGSQSRLALFGDAIEGAKEAITLSPLQRRHRNTLAHYVAAGDPVSRAFTNSTALIRRSVTLINDGEPVPAGMIDAVQELGAAFRLLLREFSAGKPEPQQARKQALHAVASAGRAYAEGVGLSGSVVIAQVRTTASEVIRATGLTQEHADELIREAFGDRRSDRAHPRVPRVPQAQPDQAGPGPDSAPRGNRPRRAPARSGWPGGRPAASSDGDSSAPIGTAPRTPSRRASSASWPPAALRGPSPDANSHRRGRR